MRLISLALLWILWCALHSLLISEPANRWVRRRGGIWAGTHRLAYVLFSALSLLPPLWYQFSLPQRILFSWHGPWRIVHALLLCYALVMFAGGTRAYAMDHFLGLRQWRDYRRGRPPAPMRFRSDGVLRWVRHPWYSGGLALLWAAGPITDTTLVSRLVLSIYLVIGSLLEERKLGQELGEPYRRYCRQVPMLIPWKRPERGRGKQDWA